MLSTLDLFNDVLNKRYCITSTGKTMIKIMRHIGKSMLLNGEQDMRVFQIQDILHATEKATNNKKIYSNNYGMNKYKVEAGAEIMF